MESKQFNAERRGLLSENRAGMVRRVKWAGNGPPDGERTGTIVLDFGHIFMAGTG